MHFEPSKLEWDIKGKDRCSNSTNDDVRVMAKDDKRNARSAIMERIGIEGGGMFL